MTVSLSFRQVMPLYGKLEGDCLIWAWGGEVENLPHAMESKGKAVVVSQKPSIANDFAAGEYMRHHKDTQCADKVLMVPNTVSIHWYATQPHMRPLQRAMLLIR